MPIRALPPATVHLLGSAQVLTTPTSLVKELVDNALDAKAASIDILISKNTLDRLEVRDNGHGISSEDFDSLGKRGHTSKLRTFEELNFIGGLTLGFRGEALASAVEMGDVSIATKTEGEAVATKVVLKAPGGVHQRTRISHPLGTTVSVRKFMYKIPVRKQTFEKEAPKTLVKINQLLRAYALARPSIRFSLKITDGGNGSWSFAPRPNDGIKEAVSQVISRDSAMECFEKTLTFSELQSRDTVPSGDYAAAEPSSQEASHASRGCFAIEAFLPKPDADATKVGTGQYLSIDSRPVSHEKGTMKKIVTMFKKYIRRALTHESEKLKNPFIRLNIKCPIASYDANVEPAKDDVLFGNESVVLELAENLLKEVYGELKPVVFAPKSLVEKVDDFELLLARNPASIPKAPPLVLAMISLPQRSLGSSSPTLRASSPAVNETFIAGENSITEMEEGADERGGDDQRNSYFNMSRVFNEEVDDGHQVGMLNRNFRPAPQQTPDREISDTDPLNPWIIAKMTTPSRHDRATSDPNRTAGIEQPALSAPSSSQVGLDQIHHQNGSISLNTMPRQTFHSDDIRALQPAVTRPYPTIRNPPQVNEELVVERDSLPQLRRRNIPEDALISLPPSQFFKGPPRSRGPNRPSVSPLTTSGNTVAPADRFVQTTLFGNNPRLRRQSDGGHAMPQIEPNPDLAWAMDFEQRKEEATRRRREELNVAQMEAKVCSSSAPPRSSPHKNRYNAAIASLEVGQVVQSCSDSSEQVNEPFPTTLHDGDPRAYLMRRQKLLASKKGGPGDHTMMSRAKSTKLPLEKIPEEERLQSLVYNMQTDLEGSQRAMEKLARTDLYVRWGSQSAGLVMSPAETPEVAKRIKQIVSLWMRTDEGKKYEVEYIFDNLLNSKSLSA